MPKVLSLICNENESVLDSAFLRDVGAPVTHEDFRILAQGVAVEWSCLTEEDTAATWRARCAGAPVDINVIDDETREKQLLIADMDSTMIEQECIDELAEFVGKRSEIAKITEQAMRGELDFEGALDARVTMLKGLPVASIEQTLAERITMMPGGKTLVATMKARGAYTALVSGGFDQFTEKVAAMLGFDTQHANHLEIVNDTIAGSVRTPILGRQAKARLLGTIAKSNQLATDQCLAVGDGANDLDMIALAGMGVAFRAKPATAAAASYQLNHADLTGLLYLQGIEKADHIAI